MFRTIMVPLDGTEFGDKALPAAAAIARRTGAALRLVRVLLPAPPEEPAPGTPSEAERRREALAALERATAGLQASGVPATADLLDVPVVQSLAEHAEAIGADLIVMTTHGRGPLSRVFLGSVADPLVRRLHIPTLLIRPAAGRPDGDLPRNLLVALDGSPAAEAMLPTAAGLCDAVGAGMTLFRSVVPVMACAEDPTGLPVACSDEPATEHLRDSAAAYLEQIAAPLRMRGLDVRTRAVVHADPVAAILEHAHTLGCDLVALESHGRSGLTRLLLGSVAEGVVRRAEAPVLTHAAH